ncbi:MAG: hypothetical protein R6V58_14355 [Planctomycetota bacterium]
MAARHEWRCDECGKLLGVAEAGRIHIRFSRGHEYIAGLPVSATCRSCHTLNELTVAAGSR